MQDGMEAIERAISIYESLPRESQVSPAVLRGMGDAQYARSSLLHITGRDADSFEPMNSAVAAYEQLTRLAPDDLGIRERLGRALMYSGTVAANINKFDDAGQSFRRALANYESLVHDRPNDTRFKFDPRSRPSQPGLVARADAAHCRWARRISPRRRDLRAAGPGSPVRGRLREQTR